jgi:hypothetical protein
MFYLMPPYWKDIPETRANMKSAVCQRHTPLLIVCSTICCSPQSEPKMSMSSVKVYRNPQMVCIDGRKNATGRTCERRK